MRCAARLAFLQAIRYGCLLLEQLFIVFAAVIPVYLIVGIGSFLRKNGTLKQEADAGMMKVAVHIMLPALILDKMIGHPVMTQVDIVFGSIALGFGFITVGVFLSYFCGGLLGMKKGSGQRTFGVTVGIQNYGYLAIPLIASLFPDDGAMAVLFVHNVGVELALWTIALMVMMGNFKLSARLFAKGPIIAVFMGIVINFAGFAPHIPLAIMKTLEMLGNCALPVALLLIGTTLFDLWGKEKIDWKLCSAAVILRLAVLPAIVIATVYFIPMSLPMKQVLVVQASLPAAMLPIILAKHYQGQVGVAVQVVLATTVVSMLSMPLVLSLAMWLLDL